MRKPQWAGIFTFLLCGPLLSQHIYKAVNYSHYFSVWFSLLMHHYCFTTCVFQNKEIHIGEFPEIAFIVEAKLVSF